jgi:hypothetical protein
MESSVTTNHLLFVVNLSSAQGIVSALLETSFPIANTGTRWHGIFKEL